jgi:hypothetical protein
MMKLTNALCLLASGLSATTAFAKEPDAVSVDATSTTGVTMQVDNAERLAGIKRVAIASFMVDIVDELRSTKDIAGVELLTGAPSEVSIKVIGTDPSRYQTMVDAMYDQAVKDLTAKGFEVVPNAELLANAEFAKLAAHNNDNPRRIGSAAGKNLYYTTHGLPQIVTDETSVIPKFRMNVPFGKKPKGDPYIGSFSMGMNSAMNIGMMPSIAKSTGVAMINVRVTLLGAQASINNAFWASKNSAKADAAIAFVPLYNRFLVMTPDGGRARVSLRDQVTTGTIGELVNVTAATTKIGQTAGNVAHVLGSFGMLGGFSGLGKQVKYGNASDFEARMNPDAFGAAVTVSFAKVSDSLVTELASHR